MTGKLEKSWTAQKQATKGQDTWWGQDKEREMGLEQRWAGRVHRQVEQSRRHVRK